jgi:hypothetical protein
MKFPLANMRPVAALVPYVALCPAFRKTATSDARKKPGRAGGHLPLPGQSG